MTEGYWVIGDANVGDVVAVVTNKNLLPHQISEWKYWDGGKWQWQTDPLLTVTGNIIILRSLY